MKKIVFSIIILIILIISTLAYTKGAILYSSIFQSPAYLSVKELKGNDTVYIDSHKIGVTPLLNQSITPGKHEIKIVKTDNTNDYYSVDKTLLFESSTNTLINLQLGPSETYSFYEILSSVKNEGRSGIVVIGVQYNKSDTTIAAGSKNIDNGVFSSLNPGTYSIAYKKNGFTGVNDQITITKGYVLTDIIHLSRQPI